MDKPDSKPRVNCKHQGEEIGYIGCSCQSVEPVYHCNIYDTPCAHKRPCSGTIMLVLLDGGRDWFTGHNPTCDKCQAYENNQPDEL